MEHLLKKSLQIGCQDAKRCESAAELLKTGGEASTVYNVLVIGY
jgi:hypothetical protein